LLAVNDSLRIMISDYFLMPCRQPTIITLIKYYNYYNLDFKSMELATVIVTEFIFIDRRYIWRIDE